MRNIFLYLILLPSLCYCQTAFDPFSFFGNSNNSWTMRITDPAIPTDTGMVIDYGFDEGSSTVSDLSGNARTGNFGGNGSHYINGRIGTYSGSFDGSTDSVSSPSFAVPLVNFTWSCWINSNITLNSSVSTSPVIMSAFKDINNRLQIYYDKSGFLTLIDVSGGTPTSLISYSSTYTANTWYNIVVTRNVSSWTLYVNGTNVANTTNSVVSTTGNRIVMIGNNAVSAGSTARWNGYLDEVRIYGHAWTSTQVTSFYNWVVNSQSPLITMQGTGLVPINWGDGVINNWNLTASDQFIYHVSLINNGMHKISFSNKNFITKFFTSNICSYSFDIATSPGNLFNLTIGSANTTFGHIGKLSRFLTALNIQGSTTVTDDIATFPPLLIQCILAGFNTVPGSINSFITIPNNTFITGNNAINGYTSPGNWPATINRFHLITLSGGLNAAQVDAFFNDAANQNWTGSGRDCTLQGAGIAAPTSASATARTVTLPGKGVSVGSN